MKHFILAIFAASASAVLTRDSGCCFNLKAYGGPGGTVGQLSDGQNRIGDTSLPNGTFCLNSNTGITDINGRGCILTPPTTQLQCDVGAAATQGFSVGCNGTLAYKNQTTFYSCPTGQNGGNNIYAQPIKGEPGCSPIWLIADNCKSCPAVTSTFTAPCPSSSTSSSLSAPPTPSKSSCPGQLTGAWQFPHLIVPINSADPYKSYGTVFNGTATTTTSTIFNFDIPPSAAGKTCNLDFLFPEQSQLETSAYTWSAPGTFSFAFLASVANISTTYNSRPAVAASFGNFTLKPGTATHVGKCPHGCPAGQTVSFLMQAIDGPSAIDYFQDSNPCPIGLYVTIG